MLTWSNVPDCSHGYNCKPNTVSHFSEEDAKQVTRFVIVFALSEFLEFRDWKVHRICYDTFFTFPDKFSPLLRQVGNRLNSELIIDYKHILRILNLNE